MNRFELVTAIGLGIVLVVAFVMWGINYLPPLL